MVAGNHSPSTFSWAALRGGSFVLQHVDAKTIPLPLGVELLGDDPFPGIGNDIGQLKKPGCGRIQTNDSIDALEAAIIQTRAIQFGHEVRVIVMLIDVRYAIELANRVSAKDRTKTFPPKQIGRPSGRERVCKNR